MDAQSFYGNLKYVNNILNGDKSDDEYISGTDDEDVVGQPLGQEDINISETEDSDISDDNEEPSTSTAKSIKKPRPPIWKESHLPSYSSENFPFEGNTNLPDFIEKLETPAEMFNFLFNDELMEYIVDQSNLFALQVDVNKPANITRNELEQFIGKLKKKY